MPPPDIPKDSDTEPELMTLKEFQEELDELNRWAQHGCADGGCEIEPPKGMHTNGGCRCSPRYFSESLLWLACKLDEYGKYRRWPIAQKKEL